MSDETIRLAEGMTGAPRERAGIENHVCEFLGCGKGAPFGFAKPTQALHWYCLEHRGHGDRHLQGAK